jgi:large subunit ribosomal protein L7/L12
MADEEVKTEQEQAAEAEEPKAEQEEPAEQEQVAEEAAAEQEQPAKEAKAETPVKKEGKKARTPKAAAKEQSGAKKATAKKSAAIEDVMTVIKGMSILELADLVKTLEEEFGVTAAAPVSVAAAAPAAGATAGAAPDEEKTEFDVILKEVGANKISVIRAVRELTTLGLKESKDLVEGAPKPVRQGVNREEATQAKQKLEEAGATADVA